MSKQRMTRRQRTEALQGFAFILPWLIGFICFALGPVIFSLGLSFCKWDVLTPIEFVGIKNYAKMAQDPLIRKSLGNTLYYAVFAIPLGMVGALATAMLLNQKLKAMRVFRTLFYVPAVTSGVATFMLWSWIFNPEIGLLNRALRGVGGDLNASPLASVPFAVFVALVLGTVVTGVVALLLSFVPRQMESLGRSWPSGIHHFIEIAVKALTATAGIAVFGYLAARGQNLHSTLKLFFLDPPKWLADPAWAMPALIIMALWGVGSGMLIYLAGLQGIPEELYEAALLDGANPRQKFWYVTIPMLSPTIFFNLIMSIIGSFQVFGAAFVMTGGGPANSTLFYVLYLFQNAMQYFRMGYASAMAWLLFIIILSLTMVQFRLSKKWVHYQ